jgi:hypothetical protein
VLASHVARARDWANSPTGRVVVAGAALVAAGVVFLIARSYLSVSDAARVSADRQFICAETGKPFDHTLVRGETIPLLSPHSGKKTGYPAELCYWTRDGGTRPDPVPVLLELYRGGRGPTYCPDCGRRVVGHNPYPQPGAKPPPTQAEAGEATAARARGD